MLYLAEHPMIVLCDSTKDSPITESQIELVIDELIEEFKKYVTTISKFDVFNVYKLDSNLSERLKGDQCVISFNVEYLTELTAFNKPFPHVEEIDPKEFINNMKYTKAYKILDLCLDLSTFRILVEEYKNINFYAQIADNDE